MTVGLPFIGFFTFRDSVNPCIRGESVRDGLYHSPLVFGVHRRTLHPFPQLPSVFPLPEDTVRRVGGCDRSFLVVYE